MRHYYPFLRLALWGLVLLSWTTVARAQMPSTTFTYSQSGPIPDTGQELCFTLPVTGLPQVIDSTYGLVAVRLNITHSYVGDLAIRLRTAAGNYINLVSRRGAGGDNFVATELRMDAPTIIANGAAPFTGSFVPEQSLNLANNRQNPNNTWSLCIRDVATQDVGLLNSFSLVFGPHPPRDPATPPGPCSLLNPRSCFCPDSTQVICDLLPDMTASGLIIQQQHTELPGLITFSNATPNIGFGPMEIHGTGNCYCDSVRVACSTVACPGSGGAPKEQITQRIYQRDATHVFTRDRPAGFMQFHPSHGHVHVDNWAEFTLRSRGTGADPRSWPIVATGAKVSFCLINIGDCTHNPGYCLDTLGRTILMADLANSGFGTVTGCGRDQGIFVGSLDIYDQNLPGMSISLPPGVCNGTYYLVSVTDPNDDFLEQNERNNWIAAPLTLTRQLPMAAPTISLSQVNGQTAFAAGGVPPGGSFIWNFNDGSPLDSVNNPTVHQFASSGVHFITLTVRSACGSRTTTRQFTVLGTLAEASAPNLGLYVAPNPTAGALTVRYTLAAADSPTLELLDLLGRRVLLQPLGQQAPGEHTTPLNLHAAGLAPGSYVAWLRTAAGAAAVRVVLQE
jgi:subtilisin-like proprotein convertase family protein